ncbi:Protein atp11, mitochondrial [Elsinoe australis]|uniref:Protein atp11, mitochondrial n=1 Tax=Elsinoe australis TaxID=40998 RepID=A0A2P7YEI6_9PEZI|nr:Protein atp11, mitochondrial [Elsinoe australis]
MASSSVKPNLDASDPSTFKHMTHLPQQAQTYSPPLIANSNAYLGDVLSSTTLLSTIAKSSSSPTDDKRGPLSAGFFHLHAGEPLEYTYTYDEMKLVLEGEFTITDLVAGSKVRAGKGDTFFFPRGSKLKFECTSEGGEPAKAFFVGGRDEGVL